MGKQQAAGNKHRLLDGERRASLRAALVSGCCFCDESRVSRLSHREWNRLMHALHERGIDPKALLQEDAERDRRIASVHPRRRRPLSTRPVDPFAHSAYIEVRGAILPRPRNVLA